MGRKPCFMDDELYDKIRKYCNKSGKTIYDATNEAITIYIRLINSGVNISLFLTELELYNVLKQGEVLRINSDVPPETLAAILGTYLEVKKYDIISILNILVSFIDGKLLPIAPNDKDSSTDDENSFTYSFKNEKSAIYFANVTESLAKIFNVSLKVKRDGTVVRVTK